MNKEEVKALILRRSYAGAFEDGIDKTFNLSDLAKENNIDNDQAWKAFEELRSDGLIDYYAMGGIITSTSSGLLHCEKNKLVDEEMVYKQNKIRTRLLVTLADILEKLPHGEMVDWEEWIREADVSNQDFSNNEEILLDLCLVEKQSHRDYVLTAHGHKKVNEYKRKSTRLKALEDLEILVGMTEQQRGHKLEDLLAEIAEDENWEVQKRVRAQGQEIDIIMHVGLHYFLSSCKWKKGPIEAKEVELLESRVRSRATANGGILFSMSRFSDNCVEEVRLRIGSALIILFGPNDIKRIFLNETTMTDILDEKIDQVMNHRKVLVDGVFK